MNFSIQYVADQRKDSDQNMITIETGLKSQKYVSQIFIKQNM